MASCPAGCCGLASNCPFPDPAATYQELACSAAAIYTDPPTTGSTPTLAQLTTNWNSINCTELYHSILYDSGGTLEYNPDNLARIQADTNNLLTAYTTTYGKDFTADTSSNAFDPLQNQLVAMCSSSLLPGACDLFLETYCQQNAPLIANDSVLNSMCGCYVADPETPGVDAPCLQTCKIAKVQQADPQTGEFDLCTSTTCVIDDVTIQLSGGTNAQVTLAQVCPGCSESEPCTCVISGVSVVDTLNEINLGANYLNVCTGTTVCYEGGAQVACPTSSDFVTNEDPGSNWGFWLWFFVVIFFVVLVVGIIFFITKKHKHQEAVDNLQAQGVAVEPEVQSDWMYL